MNKKFNFSKNYVSMNKTELKSTKGGFNRLAYNLGKVTAGALKAAALIAAFK